jgi:hypothetical protein
MESLIKCSIIDWICNLKEATQIYSMLKWKMQVKKTMKISEIQEEIYLEINLSIKDSDSK